MEAETLGQRVAREFYADLDPETTAALDALLTGLRGRLASIVDRLAPAPAVSDEGVRRAADTGPCPSCERLTRERDGWEKQAYDERRSSGALIEKLNAALAEASEARRLLGEARGYVVPHVADRAGGAVVRDLVAQIDAFLSRAKGDANAS